MIEAKIICDSINIFGNRLTTYVLKFPRIILSEMNTHRMISKNSASSRAIPFSKMVNMVKEDPFIPMKWMKDHKGMQGEEYLENEDELREEWLKARDNAIEQAIKLNELGLTKQICNRILEPYLWHTALVTASEWENFFALRAEKSAEIHIQALANKMLEVYNQSRPQLLKPGEWHIPFSSGINLEDDIFSKTSDYESQNNIKLKICTARCARISYSNFHGKDDYNMDIKLHDNLVSSGHWSPFEHCARSMDQYERKNCSSVEYINNNYKKNEGVSGNFRGFIQYRKLFASENKSEPRILNTPL